MNLLEMFKQLSEEDKNEFVKMIIKEINELNKKSSPFDLIKATANELLKKED